MAKIDRKALQLDDDDGGRLNATWSRSGKPLIVTVTKGSAAAHVELDSRQLDQLTRFLGDAD